MPNHKIYYNNRTGCYTIYKKNNCSVDTNVVNVCLECAENGKYCDCVCDECSKVYIESIDICNRCNNMICNK